MQNAEHLSPPHSEGMIENPTMVKPRKFFTFLAGVDNDLLRRCPKHIWQKYTTFGILVLLTAFFATASASFALYTTTNSIPAAVAIGSAWGFFILNVDRMMLATFPKMLSPGKKIAASLIRITLAIGIGAVISHPLTLFIFEPDIRRQIFKERQDQANTIEKTRQATMVEIDKSFNEMQQNLPERSFFSAALTTRDSLLREKERCSAIVLEHKIKLDNCKALCTSPDLCTECTGYREAYNSQNTSCNKIVKQFKEAELGLAAAQTKLQEEAAKLESTRSTRLIDSGESPAAVPDPGSIHFEELTFLNRAVKLRALLEAGEPKERQVALATYIGVATLLVLIELTVILMKIITAADSADKLSHETEQYFIENEIPRIAKELAKTNTLPEVAPITARIAQPEKARTYQHPSPTASTPALTPDNTGANSISWEFIRLTLLASVLTAIITIVVSRSTNIQVAGVAATIFAAIVTTVPHVLAGNRTKTQEVKS